MRGNESYAGSVRLTAVSLRRLKLLGMIRGAEENRLGRKQTDGKGTNCVSQ